LRDQGIAVVAESIDAPEQIGYRIRPEDFYLPDLELEPDEQAALNVAVAEVHVGDPSGRDALWRLGIPSAEALAPVAALPSLPALPGLFEAVRARARLQFTYRDERRTVDPALLRFRQGRWYLVGIDHDRDAPRTFRVDRIDGTPDSGPPNSAELPDDFDAEAALPDEPWKIGDVETRAVRVLVDALEGTRVVQELGDRSLSETHPDGSVEVVLEVSNDAALISWVLSLGPHAEILDPPDLRAQIVNWLEGFGADEGPGHEEAT
jgi:predicted DNA-binding transcriptional regulator YafY